jgi:photosystem II stability/assembly factor-like uncharacterized protein
VTASADFPLVNALQTDLGARPLWKSRDGGATWTTIDGLPFAFPQALVTAPDALYAATSDAGMAKSTDGGVTWTRINHGITVTNLKALAADPQHQGTVFAGSVPAPGVVYRTVDGGATWPAVVTVAMAGVVELLVDAQSPQNVYALWSDAEIRKKLSPDGLSIVFSTLLGGHVSFGKQSIFSWAPAGMTWQNGVAGLALDPEGNVRGGMHECRR